MARHKQRRNKKRRERQEQMKVCERIPTMQIGLNDVSVMDSAVLGYLAYLRQAVPPSQKRDKRIRLLEGVRLRLLSVLQHNTPLRACIPLADSEIQALNGALVGFVNLVRQTIPPSQERDETLQVFERLRQELVMHLALTPLLSERE
jgi:hypothetical protein